MRNLFLFIVLVLFIPRQSFALQLDPYPVLDFTRDPFSIALFREERPSFYWVNIGVPDLFFNGVKQTGGSPGPVSYSIQSIQYGVRVQGWADERLQGRLTIPFEANALVDAVGNTQNLAKLGDVEVGASYLLIGQRVSGGFFGLDGWVRLPTGTNPFAMAFPLLSTGKGAGSAAFGLVAGEELDGFSFFQSIHYEKSEDLMLDPSNPLFGGGVFHWPDNLFAEFRGEWAVFHRAQRAVSLYYQLQMRASGEMLFDRSPVPYGLTGQSGITDWLFFSKAGLVIKVDKDFSADGSLAFFPEEFLTPVYRPDAGWVFSLSIAFRPL
ncbi:MAG TPA: hypothetical protein VHE12_10775 [bacterium]|nr:hypothetical protein [bacterium]